MFNANVFKRLNFINRDIIKIFLLAASKKNCLKKSLRKFESRSLNLMFMKEFN